MVYSCNYHNSGYYPLSCLLFKTQRFGDWILSSSSEGTYSFGRKQRLAASAESSKVGSTWRVRRQRLALSIGQNWLSTTWRKRQNPVSETSPGQWIISRIVIVIIHINIFCSKPQIISLFLHYQKVTIFWIHVSRKYWENLSKILAIPPLAAVDSIQANVLTCIFHDFLHVPYQQIFPYG
jgi:hypothetical protein